jgi:hypothetical protein
MPVEALPALLSAELDDIPNERATDDAASDGGSTNRPAWSSVSPSTTRIAALACCG